ncbi:MAG: hypothetical protein ACRYGF_18150 [Janthinobacterium lividum]
MTDRLERVIRPTCNDGEDCSRCFPGVAQGCKPVDAALRVKALTCAPGSATINLQLFEERMILAENNHILICGRDPDLLRTREMVLRSAGHRVSVTLQPIGQAPDLDSVELLIVCHTLSAAERQRDLSTLASSISKAKALCLVPHAGGATGDDTFVLDSFAGPKKMLEVVKELVCT